MKLRAGVWKFLVLFSGLKYSINGKFKIKRKKKEREAAVFQKEGMTGEGRKRSRKQSIIHSSFIHSLIKYSLCVSYTPGTCYASQVLKKKEKHSGKSAIKM